MMHPTNTNAASRPPVTVSRSRKRRNRELLLLGSRRWFRLLLGRLLRGSLRAHVQGVDRELRAVGHQHEQGGRRAEGLARDAVLAGPTAVLVLGLFEARGHLRIPVRPVLAALD